ncbi:hypothetical protein FXO38_16581 [Capsicum annuum]|nr:hypothetical protein FXO38_16581 [Capsicum annuum]KAF3653646.1 hypothetical protein FXO37_16862 [Capsicum annuum]
MMPNTAASSKDGHPQHDELQRVQLTHQLCLQDSFLLSHLPYLAESETLSFVPWDPLKMSNAPAYYPPPQGIPDPVKIPKSILEELRLSSTELEQVLAEMEEPVVTNFTLTKPLRQEFNEPSNTFMVLTCPLETKLLSLILRNASAELTTAVALIPQLDLRDKGKHQITQSPPTPCNPMKFLIWNTRGSNGPCFKRQCDALIIVHNPALVSLLETKKLDHKNITELLHFHFYLESSVVGKRGGIVFMWKEMCFISKTSPLHPKVSMLPSRLDGIQKSPHYQNSSFLQQLENKLLFDYDGLLKCEEDFWKTKSRISWLTEGDANTAFFHSSTIDRRRRNRIIELKDEVPGPDGLHPMFFQKFWNTVGPSTTDFCKRVFSTYSMPSNNNATLITKIIVNRIKAYLLSIIGPTQASFLANRRASDQAIIIQEYIAHFSNMRGKNANIILKIDLEKAFDKLEWSTPSSYLAFQTTSLDSSCLVLPPSLSQYWLMVAGLILSAPPEG